MFKLYITTKYKFEPSVQQNISQAKIWVKMRQNKMHSVKNHGFEDLVSIDLSVL